MTAVTEQFVAQAPKGQAECVKDAHGKNHHWNGIIVNPWASWLAASPDRKVYLPNRQPPFGILEVKCPRVSSVLETSYLQRVEDQSSVCSEHVRR